MEDLGPRVEEEPEGGAVADGVVHGEPDEDPIGKLGDLHGQQGQGMAIVVDRPVVVEEGLDDIWDVGRGEYVGHGHVERGMDEPGPRAVGAVNEDGVERGVGPLEGGEAAGERVEVEEGGRERALELLQEGTDESGAVEARVEAARREGEEEALLDVVDREHGEIPRRQVERTVRTIGKLGRFDETVGDELDGLRRRRSHCVGCVR